MDRCTSCQLPVKPADRNSGLCPWCEAALETATHSEDEPTELPEAVWVSEPLGQRKARWILGIGVVGLLIFVGIGIWLEIRPPTGPLEFALIDPEPEIPATRQAEPTDDPETTVEEQVEAIAPEPAGVAEQDMPTDPDQADVAVREGQDEQALVEIEHEEKIVSPTIEAAAGDPEPPHQPVLARKNPMLEQQLQKAQLLHRKALERRKATERKYEQQIKDLTRKGEQNEKKWQNTLSQMRKRYADMPEAERERKLEDYERRVIARNTKLQDAHVQRTQETHKKNIQRHDQQIRVLEQKVEQLKSQER